jgi:hypothetical protein
MRLALVRNKNAGLSVASAVFALVALMHGVRLVTHSSIAIRGKNVPSFVSVIGFAMTGLLSIWLWLLGTSPRQPCETSVQMEL